MDPIDENLYSLARYRKVGFAVICGLLAIAAFILVLPFWQAIAWGVALAILVHPIYRRLQTRFRNSVAAGITTFLTLVFIIAPLILIGLAVLGEANHVRAQLDAQGGSQNLLTRSIEDINEFVRPYAGGLGFRDFDAQQLINAGLDQFPKQLPKIVGGVVTGLITFTFALLLLFFILRDSHKLSKPAAELIPLVPERSEEILSDIYDTVHAVFYGIVLVALMQGIVLGLSFWAMGLPAPLLWGMATVVLCTIPFVGAPFVWVPAALMLASQGELVKMVILIGLGVFVIGLIDNVFRPIIIGARVNLHPMAVFFAIFGGIVTLGPVGILVGPVLLSVCLGAVQILREISSATSNLPPSNVND